MSRTIRILAAGAVACTATVVLAAPALAVSPPPSSSCAAQVNQAGTPHGFAQMPGGFVGAFTSGEATSAPGYVGAGASSFGPLHGDLWTCIGYLQS
jgi:hypothetical protein